MNQNTIGDEPIGGTTIDDANCIGLPGGERRRRSPGRRSPEQRERLLWSAGVFFAIGTTIHMIDHLRRGQGSVTEFLYLMGNIGTILQVATITLILTRHRLAPYAAVAAGFPLAIGFGVAHWLPHWSAMSDPVWEIDSWRWFSYIASSVEILGALGIALVGVAALRAGPFSETVEPG